jgi:hypothetical protein
LRYSDGVWRLVNNALHFQNRLRLEDYRRIHATTGFHIIREESERADPGALNGVDLAPRFAGCSAEDLLTTHSWMVSTCGETKPPLARP